MSKDLNNNQVAMALSAQGAKDIAMSWIAVAKKLGLGELELARLRKDLSAISIDIAKVEALTVEFKKNLKT